MNLVKQAKHASKLESLNLLKDKSFLVRASAMDEISNRMQGEFDQDLLVKLVEAIKNINNQSAFVRGTITVSQIGMSSLAAIKHFQAQEAFSRLLFDFKANNYSDLVWFLESEGINIPSLQAA